MGQSDMLWPSIPQTRPAFQGHSRPVEPTWIDPLPMTSC